MAQSVLDLGHAHTLRFTSWSPDRDLNPQYDGIEDVARKFGAIVDHRKPDGAECGGAITFDSPSARALGVEKLWTVESWDPLTVSPSLLCTACGDHGFIRNGRWEPC